MYRLSLVVLFCISPLLLHGQSTSPKYVPGTILAVERHPEAPADNSLVRYDVSVQIDDTEYVALYTPPYGHSVEYSAGLEFLFSVGKDTLTLATPGTRDGNAELPILRTKKLPPQPAIDWSKASGQYFSMKMKNLSTSLNLTEEQQAKIKPIAEQESAEASGVIFTPVVPRKERLGQWQKLVRKSDAKMKPILTEAQWQKLLEIRKDQKRELSELIAKQDREGK
ncbi:MAG TPA: hypothetical protein VGV15_22940 [Terriglobales bacterium]|nr:hypothetical protein [Terriglobales bacterium]